MDSSPPEILVEIGRLLADKDLAHVRATSRAMYSAIHGDTKLAKRLVVARVRIEFRRITEKMDVTLCPDVRMGATESSLIDALAAIGMDTRDISAKCTINTLSPFDGIPEEIDMSVDSSGEIYVSTDWEVEECEIFCFNAEIPLKAFDHVRARNVFESGDDSLFCFHHPSGDIAAIIYANIESVVIIVF